MIVQFVSFMVISYLFQENFRLKETIYTLRISLKQQVTTANIRSIFKGNANPASGSNEFQMKTTSINLKKKKRISTRKVISNSNNFDFAEQKRHNRNVFMKKSSPMHNQPRAFSPSLLTIVVLKQFFDESKANLNKTLENIRRLYPSIHQVSNVNNEESLNSMIAKVKTEYFLILEEGVLLSDRCNETIESLWDALEQYPEIDFIGGSYLTGDKLRVVCHRYRLCRWIFSVSYEYERSLGHVMICDGTSSSFMGRRSSLNKIHGFDSGIHNMLIVQDLFLRAKLSKNFSVGTIPNVMFLQDEVPSLHELWQSGDIKKDIVPFAIKHKVFIFKDIEDNTIDLCSPSSPLSGKYLCNEKKAHKLMLEGGHWAYKGTFAYPYMLNYLEITLTEVIKFFEERDVQYVVIGGVSLGAIKTRSILPWEAGDIDINVYKMSLVQLLKLIEPWAKKNGYFHKTFMSETVHIFCTPRNVGKVSGGLATINPYKSETPPDYVRIKTNGIWVRYDRQFYKFFLEHYGEDFLQHKVYRRKEIIECKIKKHNACLPNFKSLYEGRAGTMKDFYCKI